MAILDLFECQVLIDDKALNEYDDDDDGGEHPIGQKAIKKYIEAESGANFAIRLSVKPGLRFATADYLCADIFLDGEWGGGAIVKKKDYKKLKRKPYIVIKNGASHGDSTRSFLAKFRFGEINTGVIPASNSGDTLEAKYDALSLIKVKVWRMKTLSVQKGSPRPKAKPVEVIPEKALKGRALSLIISLDEPEPVPLGNTYTGKNVDYEPIAVFEFKYRSKESLKQLLIIPRTPSPIPLEERPLEDLSIEEAREVIRRQKAEVEATKVRIKKERANSNLHALRVVKRLREDMGIDEGNEVEAIAECSAHKKHCPAGGQGVIELSD